MHAPFRKEDQLSSPRNRIRALNLDSMASTSIDLEYSRPAEKMCIAAQKARPLARPPVLESTIC
eukprot:6213522-Pleurochrysis_carterae.AAC.2